MRIFTIYIFLLCILIPIGLPKKTIAQQNTSAGQPTFRAVKNENEGTISIYSEDRDAPVLVQNAKPNIRPYIHPIVPPDGNGVLTQLRPDHHSHQTGLYWGFKRLNGRDYFAACCKPGTTGYYRRVSYHVIRDEGPQVKWQTVYDLLDKNGNAVLTEIHHWALKEENGEFLLDLEWEGTAQTDVTIKEFFVGGLFLRMPWYEGINGAVVNASGLINSEAEAQRSFWVDTGMAIDERNDWGHIAIFDHPRNQGFPIPWRVDSQLGVGPSRQIMGDCGLDQGETETIRYRMVIYTGTLNTAEMNQGWKDFVMEY